jgi:hypothetical protein
LPQAVDLQVVRDFGELFFVDFGHGFGRIQIVFLENDALIAIELSLRRYLRAACRHADNLARRPSPGCDCYHH